MDKRTGIATMRYIRFEFIRYQEFFKAGQFFRANSSGLSCCAIEPPLLTIGKSYHYDFGKARIPPKQLEIELKNEK